MFKKDSKGRINLNYDLIMEATEKVTSLTTQQAMDVLEIPVAEQEKCAALL